MYTHTHTPYKHSHTTYAHTYHKYKQIYTHVELMVKKRVFSEIIRISISLVISSGHPISFNENIPILSLFLLFYLIFSFPNYKNIIL